MLRTHTTADLSHAILRHLTVYNPDKGLLANKIGGQLWEPEIWVKSAGQKTEPHPMLRFDDRIYFLAHIIWMWHYEHEPRVLYPIDGNTMNCRIENLSINPVEGFTLQGEKEPENLPAGMKRQLLSGDD